MALSATVMLMDLSVAIMQSEVSAAFILMYIFAANMWVTIFIEIIVFSAVDYAHHYFYYNYAGDCFCRSYLHEN